MRNPCQWRGVSDVFFLRKMEISIYIYMIGIMENWIKHELHNLNNEILWWNDVTHDKLTICHHMTTWHDVKAWLHKHKVGYLTSSVCRWKWTGAMILLLFRMVFRSRDIFQLSPFAWPSRVTLKLKVTDYVNFVISACICPTAMNLLLFRKVVRSRKSYQISPVTWPLRVTLKLKVTLWSTLWRLLFLLVFVLQR